MMPTLKLAVTAAIGLSQILAATAHLNAWTKGMYCEKGVSGKDEENNADSVLPLYQMSKADWWFHGYNGCPNFPPDDGVFMELPAGGSFTVEIAGNRGKTSLAFNGDFETAWGDGLDHPDDYNVPTCIQSPNMHAQNRSMAAGTAFAISYTSDIKQVTPENLVVFTVAYNTPWKRVTSYQVPADLPACPPGGCICGWGWIPNGCGQPNMYHTPYRCMVTGAKSTKAVGTPKPPVWCENDPASCVKGPKQMLYWNQNEGNNIKVTGWDSVGAPKSPAYNAKCGFPDGAQNDIFTGGDSGGGATSPASSSQAASVSSKPASASSQAAPVSSQAAPVSSQAAPTSSQAAPASSQAAPSSQATPASSQAAPATFQVAPAITKAATTQLAATTSKAASSYQAPAPALTTTHQAATSSKAVPTPQAATHHAASVPSVKPTTQSTTQAATTTVAATSSSSLTSSAAASIITSKNGRKCRTRPAQRVVINSRTRRYHQHQRASAAF